MMNIKKLNIVNIDESVKNSYLDDLYSMKNDFKDIESFIKISRVIAKDNIASYLDKKYEDVSHDNGFLLIKNLPLDNSLPITPDDGERPTRLCCTNQPKA